MTKSPIFYATYRLSATTDADALEWAESVAREQTIECIDEGVPHAFILEDLLAKVVDVTHDGGNSYLARIAFNWDVIGGSMTQLLNVIFGNTAMHINVGLEDIELPAEIQRQLPGPRFGIEGIRKLTGEDGPMLCAVLKPMGQSSEELAEIAHQCVLGGVTMIKDDHGLANQKWAPFRERVEKISAAVTRANEETGRSVLYAPSMNVPVETLRESALFAKRAGAGGLLVMPGLTSWDSVRYLASDDEIALPIMSHPSVVGAFAGVPSHGLTYPMLYAAYPRMLGADVSIYPTFGGRYGFSKELCIKVAEHCRDPAGINKPILPSPGGGMSLDFARMTYDMYGDDAVYLFGGSAMRYRDKIAQGVRELRSAVMGKQK